MNVELAWEPPAMPEHGYDWEAVARLLRARPGEWLRIFEEGPVSIANAIRGNGIRALQPYIRPGRTGTGYNVRTRNNNTVAKTCALYLRYIEEGSDGTTTDSD